MDALEHAVAHNMTQASFVFGDLDFEPLLFSLNRFGVTSTVFYAAREVSDELLEAADVRRQLTVANSFHMTESAFQAEHKSPSFGSNEPRMNLTTAKSGLWNGRRVELLEEPSGGYFIWAAPGADELRQHSVQVHYFIPDVATITRAFEMTYGGAIQWL